MIIHDWEKNNWMDILKKSNESKMTNQLIII